MSLTAGTVRIILDSSTRRLQAHKVYLRASAAMRWVQTRAQLLRGEKPTSRHVNGLRAIDQRLRQVGGRFAIYMFLNLDMQSQDRQPDARTSFDIAPMEADRQMKGSTANSLSPLGTQRHH